MERFHTSELKRLGITTAEFIRRSGISPHTLKKMDLRDPGVREVTWNRAARVLAALKAEYTPASSYRPAAG